MKLQRIFMLGCMVLAIALVSCSGEDGDKGDKGDKGDTGAASTVAGPAGADGINCWDLDKDGVNDASEDVNDDGEFNALDCQGAQGVPGPSAQRIIVDTSTIPNTTNPVVLDMDLTGVFENFFPLTYIYSTTSTTYYAIPGTIELINLHDFSIVYREDGITITDNSGSGWFNPIFEEVHVLLIETTSLGGKSQADVMASLKANGVDTNNYKEVMQYFGLE